jgi:hypothetical protein
VRRRKKKLEEISAKHVQGILFVDRIVKMIGQSETNLWAVLFIAIVSFNSVATTVLNISNTAVDILKSSITMALDSIW